MNNAPAATTNARTSIVGTRTVADGIALSTITITLVDDKGIALEGATPIFTATDTNHVNVYGPCSTTGHSGVSTCTLKSTFAETKALTITSPITFVGTPVIFDPGPESQIAVQVEPPAGAIAGVNLTTQPVFKVLDPVGNIVTTTVYNVLLEAFTDPGCTVPGLGTLATAPNPRPTVAGIAAFTGVSYTKAGPLYLKASAGALASACTSLVTVVHNVANKVVYTTQPPATATAGILYTVQPAIQVQDVYGNFVNDGTTATQTVTLSSWQDSVCSTPVSGVLSVTLNPVVTVGGVASFSGVSHTRATGIRLKAAPSDPTIAPACSTSTVVAPYIPDAGQSSISGTGPVAANSYHFSTVTIGIQDMYQNPRPGDTVAFAATNTGGDNIYGACPVTDASGLAVCTLKSSTVELKTLSITSPIAKSDGTVNFIIPPVTAHSSITATGPTVADNVSPSTVTIVLRDASNLPVVGIPPTFTATDNGITNLYGGCTPSNASGISTCTLTSRKAELKTLTIVQPLLQTGSTVLFVHGPGSQLGFTTTPASGVAGTNFAAQPAVSTFDQYMNLVNDGPDSTASVLLSASADPTCATVGGGALTVAVNPKISAAGAVTFSGVNYTKAETLYLKAVASGLAIGCSAGIPVTHAAAHHLNFTVQPSANGTAGTSFPQQPVVEVQDFYGNQVNTGAASTTSILLTPKTVACAGPVGGTLAPTTLSASAGDAAFSGVNYTKTGNIALEASGGGFITGCSSTIAMGPGAAVNSTITGSGPVVADAAAASTVTITLVDAYGNFHVGVTPTFSATDTGATNAYGACSSSNASGVSACTLTSTKAEAKTLELLTPYDKFGGSVTFVAGPANKLVYTTQPSSAAVAGVSFAQNAVVQVQDLHGNPINPAVNTITLSRFSTADCLTPGTATLTVAVNPVAANGTTGSATFSGISYPRTEPLYLKAATAGLQFDCTPLITISPAGANAANSSISASGPVVADGATASTVSVLLRDAFLNPIPGVTPTFSATGSSNGQNACSATDAGGNSACGLYSQRAENKSVSLVTPVAKAGNTVTFVAGAASQLAFTVQPSGAAVAGVAFAQNPSVQVQDTFGNPLNSAVNAITLAPRTDPGCTVADTGNLTFSGANPVSANGTTGTAAFAGTTYTKSGTLYIRASAGALAGCSGATVVSAAAAAGLDFAVEPSSQGLIARNLATSPTARVIDGFGNLAPAATNTITLAAFSNPGCTVPSAGTITVAVNPLAASGGLAAFGALSYPNEEIVYLKATTPALLPSFGCSTAAEFTRWRALASSGAPAPRQNHTAVWTGAKLIVWGGADTGNYLNTGGVYDPGTDTWTPVKVDANTPAARANHTAVWTGSEMIVWGGDNGVSRFNTGARYNPTLDSWTPISTAVGVPAARTRHSAVWTGAQMIVFGGFDGSTYVNTGGVYNLGSNTWAATQTAGAPAGRADHRAVWTNTEMLVFGGFDGTARRGDGAHYNPNASGTWSAMQSSGAPAARSDHTAIWTGTEMFVWGGYNGTSALDTGGRYTPGSGGSWTNITQTGAPSPRSNHVAVWTGSQMLIWGGDPGAAPLSTGGIYTPGAGGSWSATSNGTNLPAGRDRSAGVWATDRMLIFGGCLAGACTTVTGTGALYIP